MAESLPPLLSVVMDELSKRGWEKRDVDGRAVWWKHGRPLTSFDDIIFAQSMHEIANQTLGEDCAFECPRCGRTSHHPEDKVNGYCSNCKAFTAGPTDPSTL